MTEFDAVKDSGKRQEFKTGSVRDTDEGKGSPHLLGGEALAKVNEYRRNQYIWEDNILGQIEYLLLTYTTLVKNREDNIELIYNAVILTEEYITKSESGQYSIAMRRLAKHYENGAKKYSANNWRKGQPISRYYDSAMRHLWAAMDNKTDEDHAAALLWNLIGIIQTKIDIQRGLLTIELDNFPFTTAEVFTNEKKDK